MTLRSGLLFALILVGVAGALLAGWVTIGRSASTVPHRPGPSVDCPAEIDLGEQSPGSVAAAELLITNGGTERLVLDRLETSCACIGFEVAAGEAFMPFTTVGLEPGQTVRARVAVRANDDRVGATGVLQFHTNDPGRPVVALSVRMRTVGIKASPSTVSLGTVRLGEEASHVVEIRDTSPVPHKAIDLACDSPEQIRARFLTFGNDDQSQIARVEVTVSGRRAGTLDGNILIRLDGGATPVSIPVRCRVSPQVEAFPSEMVLPRKTEHGPDYSATCLVRGAAEFPLRLVVLDCPVGVQAEIVEIPGNDHVKRVRMSLMPGPKTAEDAPAKKLKLKAEQGGSAHVLEIKILVHEQ
jgi:hypothetical protein